MDASSSTLPTASTLTAPPPPVPRVKSPPLAFEKTPNDALLSTQTGSYGDSLASPPAMGPLSPHSPPFLERQLLAIVDQQNTALTKARESFDEERKAWNLERRHLQERIAWLEQHIKPGDHWSPAKSPVLSPSSQTTVVSPNQRAVTNPSLATIAEDDNFESLAARRPNAPSTVEMPPAPPTTARKDSRRKSSVSFTIDEGLLVEEIAVTPPYRELSPPPASNRALAGHTPPRLPTPPPQKMSMDGIEDTPTRNNTHINAFLTRNNDEDEDRELRGPLMMPELPNQPNETNFTLDALSKKLEHIHEHPEHGKPMVFSEPSPGLASPASEEDGNISPRSKARVSDTEAPFAPIPTRVSDMPASDISSNTLSPSMSNGGVISPQEAHEAKVQAEFEQGGIRLKKKTSVNFGAPFGSLAFAGAGRHSQDRS